jgi:hypothetical protein
MKEADWPNLKKLTLCINTWIKGRMKFKLRAANIYAKHNGPPFNNYI